MDFDSVSAMLGVGDADQETRRRGVKERERGETAQFKKVKMPQLHLIYFIFGLKRASKPQDKNATMRLGSIPPEAPTNLPLVWFAGIQPMIGRIRPTPLLIAVLHSQRDSMITS